MARRRSAKRRGWPAHLYEYGGYYSYLNPETGVKKGLGRDKALAFSVARDANAIYANKRHSSLLNKVIGKSEYTLAEWIPVYRRLWIERASPADGTIRGASQILNRIAKEDFAKLLLPEVTTVNIAVFIDRVAEENGAGISRNMRTRLLDVFNYAENKGYIETGKNPVTPTLTPVYEVVRDRLSLEQFLAMRAIAKPWFARAMNLALLSAQRREDISKALREDAKDGHLAVDQAKLKGKVKLKLDLNIRLSTVGLSIGDVVKDCMQTRIVSRYLIHQTKTAGHHKVGDPIAPSGLTKAFAEARKLAGIKWAKGKTPPTFHEIRSLAERLYEEEYGAEFAQKMLGHKYASTTATYKDLRGSDWQKVSVK